MDHAFHQFELGKESKKIFMLYAPYDLYNFNMLVMRTAPASIDSHEGIRTLIEGLQGVVQIKDDLAVHGA